jgi:CheY-like chemotaxis protein
MANVLVVDDSPDACDVLVKVLKHAGHRAVAAHSGGAALAKLKAAANDLPDVIILDIMMPGLDGENVLRRVRNDPKTAGLKVIAFSAIDDPDYIHRLKEEGVDDYWVKGKVDYSEVGERLTRYLA